jgi:predicted amidohydrolase
MRVNLAAVQPKMSLSDYASPGSFGDKMGGLMRQAARAFEADCPSLVVFPEYLGLYFAFAPRYWREASAEPTLQGAVARIVKSYAPDQHSPASFNAAARRLLFRDNALEMERAYLAVFAGLAREHACYIVAGSLCTPVIDESPHRGGRFIAPGDAVYNQSYLLSPAGLSLHRTRKVHLPDGEDAYVDAAPTDNLLPANTAVGRIGTALCFDGYHHSVIERFDAAGTAIIAQPLYFPNPELRFDGSGKHVPQPWDIISMVQGRENIQFVVAAGQTGAVFADQRAESLSFIARNAGAAGASWESAVVAMAEAPYGECVVSATVELAVR